MTCRRVISLLTTLACWAFVSSGALAPASAAVGVWVWPLTPVPPLVAAFDPPDSDYGSGHRGIDLVGAPGQEVHAIGSGTVTFAARLAGRGVVVVDHGALRSTYEPVSAGVDVGAVVAAGEPIATLTATSSHCSPQTCLHLGVRRGAEYVDPLSLLGARPVRLKPLEPDGQPGGSVHARPVSRAPSRPASTAMTSPGRQTRRALGLGASVAAALLLGAAVRARQARG